MNPYDRTAYRKTKTTAPKTGIANLFAPALKYKLSLMLIVIMIAGVRLWLPLYIAPITGDTGGMKMTQAEGDTAFSWFAALCFIGGCGVALIYRNLKDREVKR